MDNNKSKLITALHKERFEPSFNIVTNGIQHLTHRPVFAELSMNTLTCFYSNSNKYATFAECHAMYIFCECIAARRNYKKDLRDISPSLPTNTLCGNITTVTNRYWIELARLVLYMSAYTSAYSYLISRAHMKEQTLGLSLRESRALNADILRIVKQMEA